MKTKVCEIDQLENESLREFKVAGEKIVVVKINDKVYALENRCSHEDYPLSDGWVDEGRVCCSMHGEQFDPSTGDALTLPAYENIRAFPVHINDGTVEIEIE